MDELKFILSQDCHATVIFNGTVTQEAVQKLIDLLQLSKDAFPTQEEADAKGSD